MALLDCGNEKSGQQCFAGHGVFLVVFHASENAEVKCELNHFLVFVRMDVF